MRKSPLGALSALLLLLVPSIGMAQIKIENPSIPAEETLKYLETIGSEHHTVDQKVRRLSDATHSWYEFHSLSPETETTVLVDPLNLFVFQRDSTNRSPDAIIRTSSTVVESRYKPSGDELVIPDISAIPIVLRGFPWKTKGYAKLVFLGSTAMASGFNFELWGKGRETLKINGTSWDCWKGELALSGFLGGFVGKTYFWFSVNKPCVLVKTEGPSGGPGSPNRILELQSYSADTSTSASPPPGPAAAKN